MQSFEVRKDALDQTRWRELPDPDLADGEVLLRVDRFAFTANNITYAVFGEAMHYWDFFPTGEAGWGIVPVWGFADVVASRHDGITPGERFYGYYPTATHLVVQPGKSGGWGFADASPHRAKLAEVYNRYLRTSADPGYRKDSEAQQMLFRPLFLTAFFIDDFLDEESFFGASRVILTSASSKTAFSLAFLLARRRDSDGQTGSEIIGLTSERNRAFVEGLGCYDKVLSYEQAEALAGGTAAVLVDFAGNADLRRQLHETLSDSLRYSCSVGASHWDEAGAAGDLPGPRPVLFFAPDRVRKRGQDWGPGGIEQRVAGAWRDFMAATGGSLRIVEEAGAAALTRIYDQTLAGRVPAEVGQIVIME